MAIVETLEVRFQADMSRLSAQLKGICAQFSGLGAALQGSRDSLASRARDMIAGVSSALQIGAAQSAAPAEAGASLAERFGQAIAMGAPASAAAARLNAESARFASAEALSGAVSAGAALGEGFARGIASSYSAVMRAANRIASAAVSRIRSALRIHSPSKVTFELGGYFGQGFADGLQASIRQAQQSAGALSHAGVETISRSMPPSLTADTGGMAAMVQQAVSDALGGVNLVVPLHVDGLKLGEASIRGINRVTRSAGRLMLEL